MRIIMSSLIYRDLITMASFTHQNTTVNIIEVNEIEGEFKIDTPRLPSSLAALDDNIDVPAELVHVDVLQKRPTDVLKTSLTHPAHLKFTPVLLDSHEHILPDLL